MNRTARWRSNERAQRGAVALLAVATGVMLGVALSQLWRAALTPPIDFGIDLIAYTSAATRLIETGSPYHPALLAGPIANVSSNVPIGYFYPPPLAQLFVPFARVPHTVLAIVWTAAQTVVVVWLIPTLYQAAGGRLALTTLVALLFVCAASWPLNEALFVGNVSGWIAIGVGGLLLSDGRVTGGIAAVMAIAKLTPIAFLGAAFVRRRTAIAALVASLAIVAISFALAPAAWFDWLRVLPNLVRIGPADVATNLAPGTVLGRFGLSGPGIVIGFGLAIGFGAIALVGGRREGMTPRTIAAAAFCSLFLASTLWEHYLAVVIPLIVFAWPGAVRRRQVLIIVYVLLGVTDWFPIRNTDWLRLLTLGSLVALGADLCLARWPQRVGAPEILRSQASSPVLAA